MRVLSVQLSSASSPSSLSAGLREELDERLARPRPRVPASAGRHYAGPGASHCTLTVTLVLVLSFGLGLVLIFL